jgi:Zn-dependent protease with chaperone function
MHLFVILAVLTAVTLAEQAPRTSIDHAGLRTALALLAMLVAPLAAILISGAVKRGICRNVTDWAAWLARYSRWQRAHSCLWLATVVVVNWLLGWPQLARENAGLARWIFVDDLLVLAPVYVPLFLSWAAFYDVDRLIGLLTAEDDAEPPPGRWTYVLLHARHYLAIVLLPLLVVVGVYDALEHVWPGYAKSPQGWLVMIAPVLLLVVFLPQLLASLWKTQRLPRGPLRCRLEEVLAASGLAVRDILVWQTQGRMLNAAVAGIWSRLRYVFLTDALLERLSDEEVEAVVRHEAGHVARKHLLLRLLLLGVPIAWWWALERAAPGFVETLSSAVAGLGISPAAQTGVLVPVGVALYGMLVLGWYCRQLEFEADLFACGLLGTRGTGMAPSPATAFIGALETITLAAGANRRRATWLHPSIASRVDFLRSASSNPGRALRFVRGMTWLAWLIAAGYLASLLLVLVSL